MAKFKIGDILFHRYLTYVEIQILDVYAEKYSVGPFGERANTMSPGQLDIPIVDEYYILDEEATEAYRREESFKKDLGGLLESH